MSIDLALLRTAYSYVYSKYIAEPENEIQILEPISALIKLAIIYFKNEGTKLAISNHSIFVQSPGPLQGTKRWLFGNTREELHQLLKPIYRCTQILDPESDPNIKDLYKFAILGLKNLKKSYGGGSSTISHTIDLYITILQSNLLDQSIYIDSFSKPPLPIPKKSSILPSNPISPSLKPISSSGASDGGAGGGGGGGGGGTSSKNRVKFSSKSSTETKSDSDKERDRELDKDIEKEDEEEPHVPNPLEFSISSRIDFNTIFKDIWSKDDIRLVVTLLNRANDIRESNETEKKNYVKAIENILSAKDTIIQPIINKYTHFS